MSLRARQDVRVTFGMIVLNGEPFVGYNLRALYPFAHQIIVVEGAAPGARAVATPEGHSRDGTLETLRRFKTANDPDDRIRIVTAEDEGHPDGFWSEKDQMSAAYATRATGNYLWQIDSDEFYAPETMRAVIEMLSADPEIAAVSFPARTFWGGLDYEVRGLYLDELHWHRLFKWGPGYRYVAHRPPTVLDAQSRDLRSLKWVTPAQLKRRDMYMHHYEILFPKQVIEKCTYYASIEWSSDLRRANEWVAQCYMKIGQPFRVHMMYKHLSWLERFGGQHPPEAVRMVAAVRAGGHPNVTLRATDDIDTLLADPLFKVRRTFLRALRPFDQAATRMKEEARRLMHGTPAWTALRAAKRKLGSSWAP